MRFAVAVLACVLAVANAQFGNFGFPNNRYTPGRYNQYNQGQYNQGQYNQGQYNRYQPFQQQYNKYQPFVSSTPFPKPVVAKATASVVSATPAPVVAPAPVPVVPFVPAVPVPVAPVTVARVAADARSAETIKSGYDINPDGSYNYFYETNNGIAAQQQGTPRNFGGNPPLVPDVAQGSFSWVSPEGKTISVTYVADENGYQPQSDALPVAPEIPAQIARALEYIARNAKN
ncbi:uncharacterized protein [Epargyreus clarus]|uniref:uncharacterized protein n=1 Tax=Epargyreus clarus TaxID=520877 RepID=UPI003C2E35D3